jgi:hypothetical protein
MPCGHEHKDRLRAGLVSGALLDALGFSTG